MPSEIDRLEDIDRAMAELQRLKKEELVWLISNYAPYLARPDRVATARYACTTARAFDGMKKADAAMKEAAKLKNVSSRIDLHNKAQAEWLKWDRVWTRADKAYDKYRTHNRKQAETA